MVGGGRGKVPAPAASSRETDGEEAAFLLVMCAMKMSDSWGAWVEVGKGAISGEQ